MDHSRSGLAHLHDMTTSTAQRQSSIVCAGAMRRIVNILGENDIVLSTSTLLSVDRNGSLDIMLLNLKQLKAVAKTLNASAEEFNMPKSGAKKFVWVNTIAGFFNRSHCNAANALAGFDSCNGVAAGVLRSPLKAAAHTAPNQAKSSAVIKTNAAASYSQYNQNGMNQLMGINETLPSNGLITLSANQMSQSTATVSQYPPIPLDAPVTGIKRSATQRMPASVNPKHFKHATVKIKKEPYEYRHVASTTARSLSSGEDGDRPRDDRESALVETMRNMGFTNDREILSGLRAVEAQREEVSIVAAVGSLSSKEHVEAAMMWIISQREEAEEARKEDEARYSSERAEAEMVQRRKEEREAELMTSDLEDLLGSSEEDIVISSKYFPHSIILQSDITKQMFAMILSVNDSVKAAHARKEVVRYLNLEKKATDWYGHVLPYSFFNYSAKFRFESWACDGTDQITDQLVQECDCLEKALYNLSEQEEGGVANVPKVFFQAQIEAAQKGLPTGQKRDFDDEIEIIESSSSTGTKQIGKQQPAEVIEIL